MINKMLAPMKQWRKICLIIVLCILAGCSGYKIEGDEVYWQMLDEGRGKTLSLVSGADADTFVILGHERYGKDSTGCYYEGQLIPEADADSFESISDYYAKDAQRAFYGGEPISGADGNTFRILEGNWSCDENNCFFMRSMVPGSDPESFRIMGGHLDSWAGIIIRTTLHQRGSLWLILARLAFFREASPRTASMSTSRTGLLLMLMQPAFRW